MQRTVTYRLGAALAAVVFAVKSGITAMEVHQLAAHGSQPVAAAATPPVPVTSGSSEHSGNQHTPGHGSHHAHAAPADVPHASHQAGDGSAEAHQQADGSGHSGSGHSGSGHSGSGHSGSGHSGSGHSGSGHSGSGHSEHGSTECTCVGPCASGAPPTLGEPTFAELHLAEPEPTQLVSVPVDPVHQDPRSYLLPFSNAPPARV